MPTRGAIRRLTPLGSPNHTDRIMRNLRSLFLTLIVASVFGAVLVHSGTGPTPVGETPPRYWKGNLHTHTRWSDGDEFPEMVTDWYRAQGYHFLALTDHQTLQEGEKWVD